MHLLDPARRQTGCVRLCRDVLQPETQAYEHRHASPVDFEIRQQKRNLAGIQQTRGTSRESWREIRSRSSLGFFIVFLGRSRLFWSHPPRIHHRNTKIFKACEWMDQDEHSQKFGCWVAATDVGGWTWHHGERSYAQKLVTAVIRRRFEVA